MFIIFIKNLAYYIYLSTNFQKIFRTVDWVDEHDNYFIGPVTSRKFTFSSFGGRYLQCVCVFNIYSTNWIRKPISSQLPTLQNNMISQCHFRIVSATRESWMKEKMQTIQFITKFKKKKILFYAEIKPWVTKAERDKHLNLNSYLSTKSYIYNLSSHYYEARCSESQGPGTGRGRAEVECGGAWCGASVLACTGQSRQAIAVKTFKSGCSWAWKK